MFRDHSTPPTLKDPNRPGVVEAIVFVLKPLIGLPAHVLWLCWKRIVNPALVAEAFADFERPCRSSRERRLVLGVITQAMAAPAAEPAPSVQDPAS